jgi:hypothetical protein
VKILTTSLQSWQDTDIKEDGLLSSVNVSQMGEEEHPDFFELSLLQLEQRRQAQLTTLFLERSSASSIKTSTVENNEKSNMTSSETSIEHDKKLGTRKKPWVSGAKN